MFLVDEKRWRPHVGKLQFEVIVTVVQVDDEVAEMSRKTREDYFKLSLKEELLGT